MNNKVCFICSKEITPEHLQIYSPTYKIVDSEIIKSICSTTCMDNYKFINKGNEPHNKISMVRPKK